jgi:hypothetical protein
MLDSMEAARRMGVCVVCGNALESNSTGTICWTCKVKSDLDLLKKNMNEIGTKIEQLFTELSELKGGTTGGEEKEAKKKANL